MSGPLIVAVPSKGRLQENAAAFFARAGLDMVQPRGQRTYRGSFEGVADAEIAFLSASEIVRELAAGAAHLGVTGRDLIEESVEDSGARLELAMPLGFGFADVVVAVPEAWIDVSTMADLDDVAAEYRRRHGRRLRVATKYFNLTRRFFSRHGIADYLLVESLGATEGTPAAGSADLIVDITTTGATLAANGLRTLDDGLILRSEAFLVASLAAPWGAAARGAVRTILDRIEAEAAGRTLRELRADIAGTTGVVRQASDRFGARNPFAGGAVDGGKSPPSGPLVLHCPAEHVEACADWLRAEAGATTVVVSRIETVFSASSPVHDRLLARIGGGG